MVEKTDLLQRYFLFNSSGHRDVLHLTFRLYPLKLELCEFSVKSEVNTEKIEQFLMDKRIRIAIWLCVP